MDPLPTFLSHYTRGTPFHSILECAEETRERVVAGFTDENTLAHQRFRDPQAYLQDRQSCERRMRDQSLALGGRAPRQHPLCLVLGRSDWFERNEAPGLTRVELDLDCLELDTVGFTFGDSGISYQLHDGTWPFAPAAQYRKPHHGRVFRLEDLPDLIESAGFPDGSAPADSDRRYDYYMEAQLWLDPPPECNWTVESIG